MPEPLHFMWIDDDWAAQGAARQWLESAVRTLSDALKRAGDREIVTNCFANAAEAAEELRRSMSDYRFAIVDYRYGGAKFDWSSATKELLNKGISFALFTNFPRDAELDKDFPSSHPLCVGLFPKDEAGLDQLTDRLRHFLQAPPFRVLHLSDIHFSGTESDMADGSGAEAEEEQEIRLDTLEAVIKTIARKRPLDAFVMTGDFAWHDPEHDLRVVRPRVSGLIHAAVGLAQRERVFIVPGNHDMKWDNFAERRLGRGRWNAYCDFCHAIFGDRQDILAQIRGWNNDLRQLTPDSDKTALAWHRRSRSIPLDVIGLASPTEDPTRQGQGSLDRQELDFINRRWADEKPFGAVRMLLIHHNVFGVLSLSRHDDGATMTNVGKILMTLAQHDCTVVLSGHTHVPSFSALSAAYCRNDALAELATLTVTSPGTIGGRHGAGDRRAGFNVIEFGDGDARTGLRRLSVQSYAYETADRKWSEVGAEFVTRHRIA